MISLRQITRVPPHMSVMVLILIAAGCAKRPSAPASDSGAVTVRGSDSAIADSGDGGYHADGSVWASQSDPFGPGDYLPKDTLEPLHPVTPSPATASEELLPPGTTPIAIASSITGAEATLLLKEQDGSTKVVLWTAGSDRLSTLATLPPGFDGKSIARHPRTGGIFVAGRLGQISQILSLTEEGNAWRSRVIFQSPSEINRLIVGPRPFTTDTGVQYRLFFAARAPGGGTSTKTITETGGIEYQVAGPDATADTIPGEDFQPGNLTAEFAAPSSIHPAGQPLLWQDRQGCTHAVGYDFQSMWNGDHKLEGVACGSVVRYAPNGRALVAWASGTGGIKVFAGSAAPGEVQAASDTFVTTPVVAPDGRGVLGAVNRSGGRIALAFAPIAMPLGDVANAWQLAGNTCDVQMFTGQGGFLRDPEAARWPGDGQLYTLYESEHYAEGAEIPNLVTTDLFWENFEVAYNGAFILQEQRQAIPAFNAFARAVDSVLSRTAPQSMWGKAFAAVVAAQRGSTSGEAGLILSGNSQAESTVLDSTFDFSELKARGHYTSSPAMTRYFREVHYLTTLSGIKGRDVTPLDQLPREVQRTASKWIDGYRPFIAPSRASLIWDGRGGRIPATYAKHPWDHPAIFPLSWGIDNEVLESTVYHDTWPTEEQIVGPTGRRLHPSGVDVAAMFGNRLGLRLLASDLAAFPQLGSVLNGITSRRPSPSGDRGLYQRWLDALAVEWADTASFPGAPAGAKLWSIKRLQTGLASWATLREATILVNERPSAAEAGEGGFEELVPEIARGYVEPAPRTFEAIASLYEALADQLSIPGDTALQAGVIDRLKHSAAEVRGFAAMAQKELRGEPFTDPEYNAIRAVGGTVEHEFLLYKALTDRELGITIPEPMGKIADVAGDTKLGVLEVAVGNPMEWHQVVPYFGRREIVLGSVYSYYEFLSHQLYDNAQWRREVAQHPHPEWVHDALAPAPAACHAPASH